MACGVQINKNIIIFVIFHQFLQKLPVDRISTEIGTDVGIADIITCDHFLDRLRYVDSIGGGSNLPFSTDKSSRRQHSP